jgi:ectoine hydroxylase-related dioxygenase (phytanoyl-CoA dioxygenase family)
MPPGIPRIYERYQIPLSGPREVEFVVGDERLYLEPGNAYWFQSRLMHSMVNNSSSDRISILVDIKPFLLTEVEEPAAPPLSSIMVGAQPPTRYPPGWTATASERLLESRPIAGLTEGHLSEVDVRGS